MSSPTPEKPSAGTVTVRYWASARAAAGVDADSVEVGSGTTLAELFDLSEPEIEALLARARDEAAWQRSLLPGVRRFSVSPGPRLGGAEVQLMRFAPGLRFPKHRHRGAETLFVLEGAYVDASTGMRVGAGERQDMASGTEHALLVDEGAACVAAVISRGADFTGPLLGPLHRLFAWFARGR